MKRLRVVHIIDHLGGGGAQRQLVELAKSMDTGRFDSLVCALNSDSLRFLPPLEEAGIEVKLIPQHGKADVRAFIALWSYLRARRPDIVQTWLFAADLYGRTAARLAGVTRVLSSVRSVEHDKRRHYVWADRLLRRWTNKYIVNARAVGERLAEREGVPPERIVTIYNGVDTDALAREERRDQRPPGPARVGFIGRLSPEKRPDLMVRAASRVREELPEVRFLIAGEGDREAETRELIARLELQEVVLLVGFQTPVRDFLHSLDLLVSPSDYEGCSNVILEAMAAGVPVVATDAGGNREVVTDGVGWLVPPDDADQLARVIVSALGDSGRLEACGRTGAERAREQFSLAAMVRRHEELYLELAGRAVPGTV